MESEKNIYGLSEGVFRACLYLGLKFPPEAVNKPQPVPSDYFGDDVKLNMTIFKKLCSERNWTRDNFLTAYKTFIKKFLSQQSLKHTKTDLNVYFCDHVLHYPKINVTSDEYFGFEFYNKPFESRNKFLTRMRRDRARIICNDPNSIELERDKAETNRFFADFLHRDWLDTRDCTFEDFKLFVEKHPRFFSKPATGLQGRGARIVSIDSNTKLKQLFMEQRKQKRLLEEIVRQHKETASFCPDTVNTIRVYTILDIHNVVHILTTGGKFGRLGGTADNFHGDGFSVAIDAKTGIITSDGINRAHERMSKHPDSGKIFKGFQYPCWEKVRDVVKKMAKMIPQMRYIGWDIAVNDQNEAILIEANGFNPGVGIQQSADSVGRFYLYQPLLDELKNYKKKQMRLLGYRVNNLRNFEAAYEDNPMRLNTRLKFAMRKLIPDCKSLMDLGCRKKKLVKSVCPEGVKYYPVDFKKYDDEVIACDFNNGEFPDIKVDVCLCALTAEFVEPLPQFLANMCEAANKQILMWCRPVDKETSPVYRWNHPFLTDFTEEFLIKTMEQNDFKLNTRYPSTINPSVILYDFRRTR